MLVSVLKLRAFILFLAQYRRSMTKTLIVGAMSAALSMAVMVVQVKSVAEGSPRRVEVTAKRFAFDPNVITIKKGEPVVLVLKSADVPHGLRFRELGVEVKAPKGGTGEVHFTPDRVGDFIGHCYVFCGEGRGTMTLTLHVIG
jgi:cytochrome c oxidase subunit II